MQAFWERLDQPGHEHCSVIPSLKQVTLLGTAITLFNSRPGRLDYELEMDDDWKFRSLRLQLYSDNRCAALDVTLEAGKWRVDGETRLDLSSATVIDIMGTPSTNVLPIRGWRWEPEQSRDFDVAYVRVPELTVHPVRQRYTSLAVRSETHKRHSSAANLFDALSAQERLFMYESLESDFRARLAIDDFGLVQDYPGFWRRLA